MKFRLLKHANVSTFSGSQEALPGGGGVSNVARLNFKTSRVGVSVFINSCRLLPALPSVSQFGRGRLPLVAISFYALSLALLFGPCRLSEFTLAGPHRYSIQRHIPLSRPNKGVPPAA